MAALVHELLLFERARLILGSSVEAGAWVLATWMLGLAIGAAAGMRSEMPQARTRHYAVLEVLIALLALVLVLAYTQLSAVVFLVGVAACSLLMGLTTPVLAQIALGDGAHFVHRVRWLYAANTAGAVAGVLGGVTVLLHIGLPTALGLAVAANLTAAAVLMMTPLKRSGQSQQGPAAALPLAPYWIVALLGFALLWLELLALRVLPFFARGTTMNFAWVLAVVIAGLSLGAALRPAWRSWLILALLPMLSVPWWWLEVPPLASEWGRSALLSLALLAPAALVSGALFSALCERQRQRAPHSAHALGGLSASNALGAAAGALIGGLWLLPLFGVETSWLLAWGLLATLAVIGLWPGQSWLGIFPALLVMVLIPRADFLAAWRAQAYAGFAEQVMVQGRQAPEADLVLLRSESAAAPSWRLLTNAFSMTNTAWDSQRYMRLFAALPQLLHPAPESALLISYGLGTTAAQLLADRRLRQLTVVDTSAGTLELAEAVYPGQLQDSRLTAVVEDGRHWLRQSAQRYDLITAEPPPPRLDGVQSLYTQEYFELVHARLREGGYASHWLPVDQLSLPSARAIIAAFCAAFEDCSLWSGTHYNWILLGSRQASPPARWSAYEQAGWRASLARIGIEQPWQWSAMFLADAQQLRGFSNAARPLRDDYPGRLESRAVRAQELEYYFAYADAPLAERRFAQSPWVQARMGPGHPDAWLWQPVLDGRSRAPLEDLAELSFHSLRRGLRVPTLRMLELSPGQLDAPGGALPQRAADTGLPLEGLVALLNGDALRAAALFEATSTPRTRALATVARCLGGAEDCELGNGAEKQGLYE